MLGLVLLTVSLAVSLAAGLHALRLGLDSFVLDCDVPECGPAWSGPREHYRRVALVAAVTAALGWAAAGFRQPGTAHGHRRHPEKGVAAGAVAVLGVVGVAVTLVAAVWALPLGIALLTTTVVAVALVGRTFLRPVVGGDRQAWLLAGVLSGAGLACAAAMVAAAYSLTVHQVPQTVPLLLLAPWSLPAFHLLLFSVTRRAARRRRARMPAKETMPLPAVSMRIVGPGAAVLLLVAVWSAWPVPEPQPETDPPLASPPVIESEPWPTASAPPAAEPQDPIRPAPAPVPPGVPACTPELLLVRIGGFDSAMGTSSAGVTAVNTGDAACALHGRPEVEIVQGDDPIDLHLEPMTATTTVLTPEQAAQEDPDLGVVLEPGQQAVAALLWPGYRAMADQSAPQTVSVSLGHGGPIVPAQVAESEDSGSRGPAPFDLQDDVPGGAELRVGPWTPHD